MEDNSNTNDTQKNGNTSLSSKKSKGPLLAIIGLVVVISLGVLALATGIIGGGANKNKRVAEALVSVFDGEDNSFVNDWLGQEELAKNMAKGYKASTTLELVSLPALEGMGINLPEGVMLSIENSSNAEGASRGKFGLGLLGSSLLNAEYYMDEAKLQLAVPALFNEIIAVDFSGDLAEKIKNAPLFKDTADEETLQAIRSIPQALSENQKLNDNLMKLVTGELKLSDYPGLEKVMNEFRDSWTVEEAQDKTMTWNGKEASFDGFDVTVAKEDVLTFMNGVKTFVTTDEKFREDFMDFIAGQIASQEGITVEEAYTKITTEMTEMINEFQEETTFTEAKFTIHMTKDNELVSLTTEARIVETPVTILVERYGGDFPNQNMKVVMSSQDEDDAGQVDFVSSGKTEGNVQTRDITLKLGRSNAEAEAVEMVMTTMLNRESGAFSDSVVITGLSESQTPDITLDFSGTIKDVVKGKSATQVLDKLKFSADGEVMAELKGEIKYSTEDVTVVPLEGTELDIFTATEEDMQGVLEQIMENIGVLMQFLDLGGLGF